MVASADRSGKGAAVAAAVTERLKRGTDNVNSATTEPNVENIQCEESESETVDKN